MKLLTALLLAIPSLLPAAAPDKPNVLFLVSDDLRPELGCYGNTVIKTPNIDRLAKRGMVFDRSYCQQAVCSPSRSSVMTGMRPDTTQVWDLNTHFRKALPDVVTLPELFKNHGYVTLGMGKIYHGDLVDPQSWSPTGKQAKRSKKKRSSTKVAQPPVTTSGIKLTKTDRGQAYGISGDPPDGGGEGELADAAIEALREFKAGGQPFFLAVGFHKPHLPFIAPKAYWDLYDRAEIPLAPNRFLPEGAPDFALVEKPEMWKYSGVPDVVQLPEDYARNLKHGYYAAVSYMDAQLGRVIDELDRSGMAENTIIVLWGDHGWKLGEHDRWAKHSNVEDDARAPLIIAAPKLKAADKHTSALVEFVDIYPTIAELAGLPLSEKLEGSSLKPLLENPQTAWKPTAFSQYPRTVNKKRLMGYSMRTDRYRFTRWVHRDDHSKIEAEELYDHQTDPQENVNIAKALENQALIEELTAQWKTGLEKEPKPTGKVVCFGDSITKRGYPDLLGKSLGVEAINAGVAGHSSAAGLRRMQTDVIDQKPEVVVIFFGTNDARVDSERVHVPAEKYAANLNRMIDECEKIGSKAVICTLPPINESAFFERHERKAFAAAGGLQKLCEQYRDAALRVGKKRQVPVVDLNRQLLDEPTWMHQDGVHPSPAGNEIIARMIGEAVAPLLKK